MSFPNRWPFVGNAFQFNDDLLRALAEPFLSAASPRLAATTRAGVFPPVNLFDDGETFLVRAELPGVDRDSLEITAQGDQLTLRGERKIQGADPKASYHRRECEGGQFHRTVTLPQAVDSERIVATYKNGILEVEIPRAPQLKPRRISIH
jgi:HSP20 family protein